MENTRQINRNNQRETNKKLEQTQKFLRQYVTNQDFLDFSERITTQLMNLNLLTSALGEILIKANLVSRDVLQQEFDKQKIKLKKFAEILNDSDKSYIEKATLMIENELKEFAVLIRQITLDTNLSEEQKTNLSQEIVKMFNEEKE